MAQAARLNLRMQKELKLLLSDPPPCASFPSLSSLADASAASSSGPSLTSIDAQIEGPEGTVYEKGVFKLKVQIPERYPFQPPTVMFATPIYHPNIDNGGRICLDILNLPPKGAWQPSLNISTVLTSIGLLLSEPNPDDGLMQEASREYKYNRQAFDQKARSMTETYARAGQERETPSEPNMDLTESMELATSIQPVCHYSLSHKRLCGVSKKLLLEASESDQEKADRKEVDHNFDLPGKKEIKGLLKESTLTVVTENSQTYKNLQCTKKKLQLGPKPVENFNSLIDGRPDQYSLHSEGQAGLTDFSPQQNLFQSEYNLAPNESIMMDEHSNHITGKNDEKLRSASHPSLPLHSSVAYPYQNIPQPEAVSQNKEIHAHVAEEHGNGFPRMKHKKLGLAGRRVPSEKLVSNQCLKSSDKENLVPKPSTLLPRLKENSDLPFSLSDKSELGLCYDGCIPEPTTYSFGNSTVTGQLKSSHSSGYSSNESQINIPLERQPEFSSQALKRPYQRGSCNYKELQTKESDEKLARSKENPGQESPSSDAIVVMDSEDSEDEKGRPARSKLSIARRCLPGKRKS